MEWLTCSADSSCPYTTFCCVVFSVFESALICFLAVSVFSIEIWEVNLSQSLYWWAVLARFLLFSLILIWSVASLISSSNSDIRLNRTSSEIFGHFGFPCCLVPHWSLLLRDVPFRYWYPLSCTLSLDSSSSFARSESSSGFCKHNSSAASFTFVWYGVNLLDFAGSRPKMIACFLI